MFISRLKLGSLVIKYGDQGWMEYAGGQGVNRVSLKLASYLDLLNYSNLKFYVYFYFLGLITLIILIYLNSLK